MTTDFATKLKTWPLVDSPGSLSVLLRGVKECVRAPYTHVADPPCHASTSRNSFHFGAAPNGGLLVGCWGCQSRGYLERLEETLRVRLQVRMPDGHFRWPLGGSTARPPRAGPPVPKAQFHLPAALGAGPKTLGALMAMSIWFPASGKKGWTGFGTGYRQSMEGRECGWPGRAASMIRCEYWPTAR